MNQNEKRLYLIRYLINENGYSQSIPADIEKQKMLLRALFNIRMPMKTSDEFLRIQDEYLKEEIKERGLTDIEDLSQNDRDIYLWKGDITTLKVDAIVNAANSQALGCFLPNHSCIDNAIHTFAGIELRDECKQIMDERKANLKVGEAIITKGYNLPSKYVIHTLGPTIYHSVKKEDEESLGKCYISSLELAKNHRLSSIAFCSISTGVFRFPNELAANIAISSVKRWKEIKEHRIKVIFNVFKDLDYEIYDRLLRKDKEN